MQVDLVTCPIFSLNHFPFKKTQVDLVKGFPTIRSFIPTTIYLQRFVSIQPRTSLSKFAKNSPKVRQKVRETSKNRRECPAHLHSFKARSAGLAGRTLRSSLPSGLREECLARCSRSCCSTTHGTRSACCLFPRSPASSPL